MEKDEVRRLFPVSVAFADECRRVFGNGVKLVHAREGGREIGKRVVHDPENVVNVRDMCLDSLIKDDAEEGKRGK